MHKWLGLCFMAASVVGASAPARATSSIECVIADRVLKLTAQSSVSDGLAQGFVGFKANAEILMNGVPEDVHKLDLSGSLVHHWIEGGDLRLRFYWERGGDKPHTSVELIIRTSGDVDELELAGTYNLTIFTLDPPAEAEADGRTSTAEGKAVCSLG